VKREQTVLLLLLSHARCHVWRALVRWRWRLSATWKPIGCWSSYLQELCSRRRHAATITTRLVDVHYWWEAGSNSFHRGGHGHHNVYVWTVQGHHANDQWMAHFITLLQADWHRGKRTQLQNATDGFPCACRWWFLHIHERRFELRGPKMLLFVFQLQHLLQWVDHREQDVATSRFVVTSFSRPDSWKGCNHELAGRQVRSLSPEATG